MSRLPRLLRGGPRDNDMQRTAHKNPFYHEPGHIKTASELGLGTWDLDRIDHKRLQVG